VSKTQFNKASRVFVADCSRQEAFTACIAWRQNSMGERAAKKIFCAMRGTGFCGVQEPDFSWAPHQFGNSTFVFSHEIRDTDIPLNSIQLSDQQPEGQFLLSNNLLIQEARSLDIWSCSHPDMSLKMNPMGLLVKKILGGFQ
jgi:hypothetical protein